MSQFLGGEGGHHSIVEGELLLLLLPELLFLLKVEKTSTGDSSG